MYWGRERKNCEGAKGEMEAGEEEEKDIIYRGRRKREGGGGKRGEWREIGGGGKGENGDRRESEGRI